MMGYTAVKDIRIKQGNVINKKKAVNIKKNTLSNEDNIELKKILKKVKDKNLKKKLTNFSRSFFSNID